MIPECVNSSSQDWDERGPNADLSRTYMRFASKGIM